MILRILRFQIAPHLVGKYIIPGSPNNLRGRYPFKATRSPTAPLEIGDTSTPQTQVTSIKFGGGHEKYVFLNNSNTRNKLCKSKSNRSCCIFPKSSKLNSIESKIPSFRILLNQKAHHFQAGYSPGSLDKVPRQAPPKVCPRYPENESQKVQLPVFDKIDVNI